MVGTQLCVAPRRDPEVTKVRNAGQLVGTHWCVNFFKRAIIVGVCSHAEPKGNGGLPKSTDGGRPVGERYRLT